ncbi:MAG: hypothetical protein L6R42_002090 [Xanthoria sp. 1 TBL-2021]|nr:MAG: hypothetical protein L6R42_002090 [Xanthoria sp. 1 TBL-2021]
MEKAHQLINESGLKIFSIEDLQNAAEKSVQFSKVVKMGELPRLTPTTYCFTNGRKARDIDVGVEFNLGL